MFTALIFATAIAISSVAAYFSLVGLGSLFAATFWGVVIMAGCLEVGKIVATKWVHANWRNPGAPWFFRGLLCFFIGALMLLTSIGIYGYLSKGHVEQVAPLAGIELQASQIETQIKQNQTENARLEARLDQISRITDRTLEGGGRAAIRASNQQRAERQEIQGQIDANNEEINQLNSKLAPIKAQAGDVEGELGAARYLAEAMGWDPDKAIRLIIFLIMVAFDPLALSLFIAASISLRDRKDAAAPVEAPLDTAAEEIVVEDAAPVVVEKDELVEEQPELPPTDTHEEDAAASAAEAELEAQRAMINQDRTILENAHANLLDMEKRLMEERDLLKQWEDQLIQQQVVINEGFTPVSEQTAMEQIIKLLEENPEVISEIVSIANSMLPPPKPGL